MVKKKAKKGKKRKPAQPKTVPIQAYDLETISVDDLKKYITSLQKEIALMRKDCEFYSTNRGKIMDFLESARNAYSAQNRKSVVNNFAIDDIKEGLRNFPVKFNEKMVLKERDKARLSMENELADFIARATAETDHLDEERFLKQQITDRDKRIEYDQYLSVMTLLDMKENCQKSLEGMDVKGSKKLEAVLLSKFERCLKNNQDCNANKIRKFVPIWDIGKLSRMSEMEESYISEVKRMQEFFCDLSSTNAEIIKMLRGKLTNLLIERQKMNLDLNKLLNENKKLRDLRPSGFALSNSPKVPVRASRSAKNIREQKLLRLEYKNEALIQMLRMKQEDLQNLKQKFIGIMRKIHQKAAFKAFMMEEVIRLALQLETLESIKEEPKAIKPTVSRKDRDTQRMERG